MENVSILDPLRKQEMETMMRKLIKRKRREFEEKRRMFIFEKIHKLDVLHKKKFTNLPSGFENCVGMVLSVKCINPLPFANGVILSGFHVALSH